MLERLVFEYERGLRRLLERYHKEHNIPNPITKGCLVWLFSVCIFMKTENGDEDVFGWISENIFSENENRK